MSLIKTEAESLMKRMMPETELKTARPDGKPGLGNIETDFVEVKYTIDDQDRFAIKNEDEDKDNEEEEKDEGKNDDQWREERKDFPSKPLSRDERKSRNFLSGTDCVDGGIGWWKYEFCFGKQVTQFHEYEDGKRINVLLGTFDEQKQIEFIKHVSSHIITMKHLVNYNH